MEIGFSNLFLQYYHTMEEIQYFQWLTKILAQGHAECLHKITNRVYHRLCDRPSESSLQLKRLLLVTDVSTT